MGEEGLKNYFFRVLNFEAYLVSLLLEQTYWHGPAACTS